MLDVCPMWYLGFSMFLGVLIAVFVYYVIVLRNFFMKAVMHKPEGYVSHSLISLQSIRSLRVKCRVFKIHLKYTVLNQINLSRLNGKQPPITVIFEMVPDFNHLIVENYFSTLEVDTFIYLKR